MAGKRSERARESEGEKEHTYDTVVAMDLLSSTRLTILSIGFIKSESWGVELRVTRTLTMMLEQRTCRVNINFSGNSSTESQR